MAVDITQIGSVYDSLEAKIKATLDEQWNNGRLTGSDYAQVLSSTITQAMQLAVQSVQTQPEIDAKVAKVDSDKLIAETQSANDTAIKSAQKDLYNRQTQGFDDNLKQKLMEIQLNAWSLMFSSGMLTSSPAIITNDEASTLYNNLKIQLGI